jgi:predicted NUDIX family NTP pyrophosphohydrolase
MKILWHKHCREVIEFAAVEYEFEVKKIQEWHLRLTHPVTKKRLDFFPKTCRATWVSTNKWFTIPDIEKFIEKEFKR